MDAFLDLTNVSVHPLNNVSTTQMPGPSEPMYLGFIAAAVSVVFFGSNFVPVKKFETGDGMFFQWVLCASIWFVGLIVNAITGFYTFYPLAMMGGSLWCIGNTMVVPIIKTIGLGQGLLIWASFNLMMGWASGRFGFFGLHAEVPKNVALNYVGIVLCLCSAVIFIFIKSNAELHIESSNNSEHSRTKDAQETDDEDLLLPKVHVQTAHQPNTSTSGSTVTLQPATTFLDRLSPMARRIIGIVLAVISGLLYGASFAPVIYIQNNYLHSSQSGLDYVFAHFSGIFSTSTVIFICYCVYMRNAPRVYPRAILPGFLSGVMWAIADAAWFVANDALSEAVSFPIITMGPGVIAALWGVVLFKEIRGLKNILLLLLAFAFAISGSIITGFSKA